VREDKLRIQECLKRLGLWGRCSLSTVRKRSSGPEDGVRKMESHWRGENWEALDIKL
jgi:hypothetical protein